MALSFAQRQLRGSGLMPAMSHWPHAGPVPLQFRFALTTSLSGRSASCAMPVQPESSEVAVWQRPRVSLQVPTGQSVFVVQVSPVPAAMIRFADVGHSADPPIVVVDVVPVVDVVEVVIVVIVV